MGQSSHRPGQIKGRGNGSYLSKERVPKRLLSPLFSPQVRDKHTDELGQPVPSELHMANLPLTPNSGNGDERSMLTGRGTPELCNRSKGSGAHRLGDLRLVGRNNDEFF